MTWLSALAPGNAPNGRPILSVLGKQTYRFTNGAKAEIDADEQIPFYEKDEYWGDKGPQSDAVRVESDLVAYKPATDIILVGKARPPRGKKALFIDAGIQVGKFAKLVRAIGDRKVFVTGSGIGFSEPIPFEEMPLHYGLAYGGKDEQSDPGVLYIYPKNPVGKGFIVKNNPKALQDLELPNLEDPRMLLTPGNLVMQKFERWREYPEPVSLGFTGRNFHPRYTLAGLPPDDHAQAEADRQREIGKMPEVGAGASDQGLPAIPMLNPRFFNGAAPGLVVPFLVGDETVKLANLDADFPQFTFTLPGIRPRAWLDVGEGPETLSMSLHTVTVFKETNQMTMLWRGCAYYAGPEAMKKFTMLEYGVED